MFCRMSTLNYNTFDDYVLVYMVLGFIDWRIVGQGCGGAHIRIGRAQQEPPHQLMGLRCASRLCDSMMARFCVRQTAPDSHHRDDCRYKFTALSIRTVVLHSRCAHRRIEFIPDTSPMCGQKGAGRVFGIRVCFSHVYRM